MSWVTALGLKLLGAGKWLKAKVPWQVWAAIALAIALWLGIRWHAHQVQATWNAGYKQAQADDREAALNLQAQLDAANARIAQDEKDKNDAENRRITADAADISLRGPGKASAACPRVASPTGRPQPASVSSSIAPAEMPPDDGADPLAAVSWRWLVGTGKQCDLELAENVSWRSWYQRLANSWPKNAPPANTPAHDGAR